MDAWLATTASTFVGAAIAVMTQWVGRRWTVIDKLKDRRVMLAEEFADIVRGVGEWSLTLFRASLSGNAEPPPWSLFRMQVLVQAYFQELDVTSKEFTTAIGRYQSVCGDIATWVMKNPGVQPPQNFHNAVKAELTQLTQSASRMTEAIAKVIRKEHEH